MGTTLIIVELLIIGFQVLVWVTLLLWPVLDPKYICLDQLKDWVSVVALSVLAMAYTLGIVFDRILGLFTSTSCFRWLIPKFEWLILKLQCGHQNSQTDKPTSTETPERKNYYITQKNPEAYKQWRSDDRRVDLLRATFFNTFLIAVIGCFKYWLYWKIWLSLFILGAFATITWYKARRDSNNDRDQLYEFAKSEDQKAKKQ